MTYLKTYLMEEILKAQKDFYIPYDKELPPPAQAYRDKEARIKAKIYEDLLYKLISKEIICD